MRWVFGQGRNLIPLFIFDEMEGWEAFRLVSCSRRISASRLVKDLMSSRKFDILDDTLTPFISWLMIQRW